MQSHFAQEFCPVCGRRIRLDVPDFVCLAAHWDRSLFRRDLFMINGEQCGPDCPGHTIA